MENILVTGGAGFIGSHLVDALLSKGTQVICLDNFNDYYSPEVKESNISHNTANESFSLVRADITDYKALEQVFDKHKPDKVVHLAARAGVRPSIEDPFIYEKTNVLGTLNLLELSRKQGIKQFIFGSSSSVYGENNKVPFEESDATDFPISPYAATKKSGEILCYTYSKLYDLKVTCLRFFTVYGPRGRPDMAPYLFTKSINEGAQINMFGDGTTRRDYTYVADIVSGIMAALDNVFDYEIFNLGNSDTVELKKLIETIEEAIGKKADILQKPIPKGDVPITYADLTKSRRLLKYSPTTNIKQGISSFVKWYLEQQK